MKYLVNRETKEHKRMPFGCLYAPTGWGVIQADTEGWIKHDGGECPLPDDALCAIRFKSGALVDTTRVAGWGWWNATHYRPILEDKPQPAPAPDYDPRSVSFNLLDRLTAAHQSASEIPDLVEQLRAQLEPLGLGVIYLSQFDEVEPEPDMSDPANWKAGDIVTAINGTAGQFTVGTNYEVRRIENEIVKVIADNRGSPNGWHVNNFRFHSRPEPTT